MDPARIPSFDSRLPRTSNSLALVALFVCLTGRVLAQGEAEGVVRVGSKSFTEGIVLGEIVTLALRQAGFDVVHERSLGDASTFQALVRGDIDVYADYTGTLRQSIFASKNLASDADLPAALAELGLRMTKPLGFENSFAIGTTRERAAQLKLQKISDLRRYPELRFGFTESFLNRGDGWPALKRHYQLPQTDPRGMAHELAYVALLNEDLDAIDLYTTDAEIEEYDLVALPDDQQYFPRYEAIYLYREDLATRFPRAVETLTRLENSLTSDRIRKLNAGVKIDGRSEAEMAAEFLSEILGSSIEVQPLSSWARLWARTLEHLLLVGVAMGLGIVCAVPLGMVAQKHPPTGQVILALVNILQTIPALALLALMVPLLGINYPPAIAALFCYSMLPIVRNTHAGLAGVETAIREAASACGMSPWQRLWKVEFPLASPMILAGIKTSTVLSIGFATLGAFVGAGGYGEPILTGIRLQDTSEILLGAVPAALMAIGSEFLFGRIERVVVPKGLLLTRK